MTKLTTNQGKFLLEFARSTIESDLSGETPEKPAVYDFVFDEPRGVFVTLNTSDNALRGCIGYPEPVKSLIDAVMDSARQAARDPRFPEQVTLDELKTLKLEITVLTKPERVLVKHYAEYTHELTIGNDGLIVAQGFNKGLLLPQVAWDWGWNEKQFLEHTCQKAGLDKDAYKDLEKTHVYKFQGQVFEEEQH